ncbi:MAG: nicotinate-nucleotide--dimethylbenzimidazole phosphoribosyltransferase, partial [Prevotella sp.]
MQQFNIEMPDGSMREAIQSKIDNLNKPKGSLGRLESLALQICLVQQTLSPALLKPQHLLLGGDHGIEREGVSVSPREITWQQMINFTRGGGGVNMFCRQHGFKLNLVDVGVDYDLSGFPEITDRKIANGTDNFLYHPAMSREQFDRAIMVGVELIDKCISEGTNIICIGEMGIANTSPSSVWMSLFGNIPLEECIGAGAGLDRPGIRHKCDVLQRAVNNFLNTCKEKGLYADIMQSGGDDAERQMANEYIIRYFGGFEMVAAIGAMLRAAERHLLIMVDGFIMTACALAASRLYPVAVHYMIFGHCGDESGHRRMLSLMNAAPLLSLGLRLGEGTGALCSFPIIESAVRMINEMNNFQNANINKTSIKEMEKA